MPPQKTQPAPVITDGDRLAALEGLVRHVIEELQYVATQFDLAAGTLAKLERLADEAAPLLESPVAKFMAQRRAQRAAKASPP